MTERARESKVEIEKADFEFSTLFTFEGRGEETLRDH